MKSVFYKIFLWTLLGIGCHAFAQGVYADSLQSVINNPITKEKDKPSLLNQLAEAYRINRNYSAAEHTARQSARIALRNKNYLEATKAYTLLTVIKANDQQIASLKKISDSALMIAQLSKKPLAMASAYYAKVFLYKTLDDPEKKLSFASLD